jgi:hypothetical protein
VNGGKQLSIGNCVDWSQCSLSVSDYGHWNILLASSMRREGLSGKVLMAEKLGGRRIKGVEVELHTLLTLTYMC